MCVCVWYFQRNWGFSLQKSGFIDSEQHSFSGYVKHICGDTPTNITLTLGVCGVLQYKTRSNCICQFHSCCRPISVLSGLLSKTNLVLAGQWGLLFWWLFWRMLVRWLQLHHELSPYSPIGLGSQPCRPGHGTTAERLAEDGPVRCWACIAVEETRSAVYWIYSIFKKKKLHPTHGIWGGYVFLKLGFL